jgi:hypothetical protein
MTFFSNRILAIAFFVVVSTFSFTASAESDAQIKKNIIAQSIAQYPGNCPCPYNTDRAGRNCGRRSAYSRAGGYSPLCYPQDVTDRMVQEYKNR